VLSMRNINQITKRSLDEAEIKLLSLQYAQDHSNESYEALEKLLQCVIDLIPGYIENVRALTALKYCLRDVGSCNTFRSESDFLFIRNNIIENIRKIKLYPDDLPDIHAA